MSIKKMLLLASMSLAAIAFAAPAVAQADVTLTDSEGQLKVGAKVTATSSNLETHTTNGSLHCANVTLHLELTDPGPEHLELKQIEGAATTANCTLKPFGLPVTVGDGTLLETLTINTWGTGIVNATFNSQAFFDAAHESPVEGTDCHLTGPVHLQGTHETDTLHVDGHLTPTPKEPDCNTTEGKMTGTFTIETPNEDPIIIDFETTG